MHGVSSRAARAAVACALLPLAAVGCLVVIEPEHDEHGDYGLSSLTGHLHACELLVTDYDHIRGGVCFARASDIARWSREMIDLCATAGYDCLASCAPWSLLPCSLVCDTPGYASDCHTSYSCYCPDP
jgi:hypothetical protein